MRDYLKVKEDTNDKFNFWRVNHNKALSNPIGVEVSVLALFEGIRSYMDAHALRYNDSLCNDYVLNKGLINIVEGIRVFLNGELGRLDAGTLDAELVKILRKCGQEV